MCVCVCVCVCVPLSNKFQAAARSTTKQLHGKRARIRTWLLCAETWRAAVLAATCSEQAFAGCRAPSATPPSEEAVHTHARTHARTRMQAKKGSDAETERGIITAGGVRGMRE